MIITIKEEGKRRSRLNSFHKVNLWVEKLTIDHDGEYEKLYLKFYPHSAKYAADFLDRLITAAKKKQKCGFTNSFDEVSSTYTFSNDTMAALVFLLQVPDCISHETYRLAMNVATKQFKYYDPPSIEEHKAIRKLS